MAHTRHSRPGSGLGFQANILTTFQVVPSSLESGAGLHAKLAPPRVLALLRDQRMSPCRASARERCWKIRCENRNLEYPPKGLWGEEEEAVVVGVCA